MPGARLKRAVTLVNNYICTTHEAPMLATLFFGVLDTQSGELWYINAGHDLPYVLRDGSIHGELPPTGPLVGAFPGVN
jgi:sigma-B regulation protein RsbU (phosphoserine phosphatase)